MHSEMAVLSATSVIFLLTYTGLALGKIPRLSVDRAGIAVIGMAAMLASGLISMKDAAASVDYDTIALLFGMMVLVAFLRIAGFFELVADYLLSRQPGPMAMLALTMFLSGVLSAFLVNDVVCVSLTPLILNLCQRSRRPPLPYLIGLAIASNVGSAATITGNPQNIIIGSLSGISYLRFAARLAPIAIIGLLISFLLVAWVYRKSLQTENSGTTIEQTSDTPKFDRLLLWKGIIITVGALACFFAGLPIATVAIGAAALMLLSKVEPERVYKLIDWPLLVMFIGLFVVVHVFDTNVVRVCGIDQWEGLAKHPVASVSLLSVVLSNVVSNVPAVLLFKPIIELMPDSEQAWLVLAMSSTFAGNLTLLGSVANLIVVENARRAGIEITFTEYLKVGIPVTILTTLSGSLWLSFIH